MRALLAFVALCLFLVMASPAYAGLQRFAVVIGNNEGQGSEPKLKFAETDAGKMRDVLRDLGDFPAGNIVFLSGESADDVRKAIVDANERVRQAVSSPDQQAVLVVYYSGHADATALHLGSTSFELRELEQLVRGSAANFRLLVVDACRSGALTRVKGGGKAAPVSIRADMSLASQGAVFLTASASGEDAQESDTLKGSFFTHYLVSGLRGAADRDFDGQVTLDEAYEHAYESTIRATSSSSIGVQHPTFRYEVRGQTQLVLTSPGTSAKSGKLSFPTGKTYLVLVGSDAGSVVGEIGDKATARSLTVRPGTYFIRARASDHLLEGTVEVASGGSLEVDDSQLKKAAFARLVRKGEAPIELSHGPRAGFSMRTSILEGSSPCYGAALGWALALQYIEITPTVTYCRASLENSVLDSTQNDIGLTLTGLYMFDVPVVSFGVGLTLGGGLLYQTFETRGLAPDRATAVGRLGVTGRAEIDLTEGVYLDLQGTAETSIFLRSEPDGSSAPTAEIAFRPTLGFGKWF